MPFCHFEVRATRPKSERYPKEFNTLGDHIRSRRLDLDLFQSQAAQQIGVHEATLTNWEGNTSSPPVQYMPAIIRFLGYDPLATGTSMIERLIARRQAQGLSQRQMAERLGVDPGTLQGWESGHCEPSRKKRELISGLLRTRKRSQEAERAARRMANERDAEVADSFCEYVES